MSTPPAVVESAETFDGTWPWKARYTDASGFRMHYVDEGSGPETLLLLHGEPTWGYLFRHLVADLSRRHRVVVPDHMGFGKSETPQNRSYWLQDHIDNLERFVLDRDLTGFTLVLHDFGGPVGMGLAARHPDRIRRVVSVNGPTPFGQADLAERATANVAVSPWFQWILRAQAMGTLDRTLGDGAYNILSTLKLNGFERGEIVTPTWLRAYAAPFPTPQESLGAIGWAKGYATGAHRFEEPDAAAKRSVGQKPALALWGEADRTLHAAHFLPLFEAAFPKGVVRNIPGAGHYSPEDAPEVVTALIDTFVRLT